MRENGKLISIIVTVFNAMPYLKDCLNSVCRQSCDDIEIILVDDGATDTSGAYCDRVAACDSRVKVVHGKNRGLVSARKIGIDHAAGKYFIFVDSDDEIDMNLAEILREEIERSEPDIILFGLVEESECSKAVRGNYFDEGYYDTRRIKNEIIPNMITGDEFFSFHILPNLVCKCIKRSWYDVCVKSVSTGVTYGEDADLTYQLIPQAETLSIIDRYPYHYKRRSNSMVSGGVNPSEIAAIESDLKATFTEIGLYGEIEDQLKRYMSFVYLVKMPDAILDLNFGGNCRIALYGSGGFGQALRRIIDNVVLWVDKNYRLYQRNHLDVCSADALIRGIHEYDVIFIAVTNVNVCAEIAASLRTSGITKPILYIDYSNGKVQVCRGMI